MYELFSAVYIDNDGPKNMLPERIRLLFLLLLVASFLIGGLSFSSWAHDLQAALNRHFFTGDHFFFHVDVCNLESMPATTLFPLPEYFDQLIIASEAAMALAFLEEDNAFVQNMSGVCSTCVTGWVK